MELKIDRGLKSYEVTDADGTPLGTIYINPADVGIVARLEEAGNAIQKLADGLTDDAQISDVVDADQAIKAQVDYIFGSKASDVFFKGISALALLPDGTMVFEKSPTGNCPPYPGRSRRCHQGQPETRADAYCRLR